MLTIKTAKKGLFVISTEPFDCAQDRLHDGEISPSKVLPIGRSLGIRDNSFPFGIYVRPSFSFRQLMQSVACFENACRPVAQRARESD